MGGIQDKRNPYVAYGKKRANLWLNERKNVTRHRHRSRILVVFALTGCIAVVGWNAASYRFDGTAVDPGTPLPLADGFDAQEQAFYEYVAPRLRVVVAEAKVLVNLGQSRSRNIFELRRRGDRVETVSQGLDRFLADQEIPARFLSAISTYEAGIAAVRSAVASTRSALGSFDWESLERAVDVMAGGTEQLKRAQQLLEAEAGAQAGTPSVVIDALPSS